ncbi:outer membrane protein transport protein, partial [Marinobacter sp. MC3]
LRVASGWWGEGAPSTIKSAYPIKAGYAFDESPVGSKYLTARVPSSDRHWLTLGFQWLAPRNYTLDLAAGYLIMDDPKISELERDVDDNPIRNQAILKGEYAIDAWGIGVQVSKAF